MSGLVSSTSTSHWRPSMSLAHSLRSVGPGSRGHFFQSLSSLAAVVLHLLPFTLKSQTQFVFVSGACGALLRSLPCFLDFGAWPQFQTWHSGLMISLRLSKSHGFVRFWDLSSSPKADQRFIAAHPNDKLADSHVTLTCPFFELDLTNSAQFNYRCTF